LSIIQGPFSCRAVPNIPSITIRNFSSPYDGGRLSGPPTHRLSLTHSHRLSLSPHRVERQEGAAEERGGGRGERVQATGSRWSQGGKQASFRGDKCVPREPAGGGPSGGGDSGEIVVAASGSGSNRAGSSEGRQIWGVSLRESHAATAGNMGAARRRRRRSGASSRRRRCVIRVLQSR
jgi:hypothetical protein